MLTTMSPATEYSCTLPILNTLHNYQLYNSPWGKCHYYSPFIVAETEAQSGYCPGPGPKLSV